MAFFEFSQNNSGGFFEFDAARGLTERVIIEAASAGEACDLAQAIGIYFDGCNNGADCWCCGDRWYPVWGNGDDVPSIDGTPLDQAYTVIHWAPEGFPDVFTHYKHGVVVGTVLPVS